MRRVLVIDDDPLIRQTIRFALEEAGFCVDEAESGVDGCRAVADRNFDLKIDGGEFLSLATRLGVNDTIGKPFQISALLAKVERLCANGGDASVAAAG